MAAPGKGEQDGSFWKKMEEDGRRFKIQTFFESTLEENV
jgi:hypothetical protein